MDHYVKRADAKPNISVETFTVPNLCKPYEMISIGIVLGFPLYRVDGLRDSARDYHAILDDRSHPMHLFNHPTYDARYFPDPFRDRNYLNPKQLWEGLRHYDLIEKGGNGKFVYDETMHVGLRSMHAREEYLGSVRKVMNAVTEAGGVHECSAAILTRAILSLGMLKKDSETGHLKFRKDYDVVVRDILDGDGTGDRASKSGLSKDEYIAKHIPSPTFADERELVQFLEKQVSCREFLARDVGRIFDDTRGNLTAGAAIEIPRSKMEAIPLPEFADEIEFYDYFEMHGSLEWQNYLKNELVRVTEREVRRFRLPADPTLLDRGRIRNHLADLADKLPSVVAWEVMVNTGVIK